MKQLLLTCKGALQMLERVLVEISGMDIRCDRPLLLVYIRDADRPNLPPGVQFRIL